MLQLFAAEEAFDAPGFGHGEKKILRQRLTADAAELVAPAVNDGTAFRATR